MDIFTYEFMQRAFLAGILVAVLCPIIGLFIVIKRQSLIGDGLGHIAFAGVTGGSLLHIYPVLGAAIFTALAAVGIEIVRRRQNQYADMILALVFYTGLALAVIFSTMAKMPSTGILSFLFGSILTVTTQDIILIMIVGAIVIGILKFVYNDLLLTSFDEEIARVSGVNVNRVNMLFSILTAFVVVMGMSVVGILLISALMIIPVASAHLWKVGFKKTLFYAIAYAFMAVILGLLAAFKLDMSPGGTIVIMAVLMYILTFGVSATRH